eukprot:scaffold11125_cov84-Isochrysis_galbana.AAC.2
MKRKLPKVYAWGERGGGSSPHNAMLAQMGGRSHPRLEAISYGNRSQVENQVQSRRARHGRRVGDRFGWVTASRGDNSVAQLNKNTTRFERSRKYDSVRVIPKIRLGPSDPKNTTRSEWSQKYDSVRGRRGKRGVPTGGEPRARTCQALRLPRARLGCGRRVRARRSGRRAKVQCTKYKKALGVAMAPAAGGRSLEGKRGRVAQQK